MTNAKYSMLTVAKCEASFMGDAVPLTVKLAGELVANAGSLGARAGVISTGEHTGSLFLGQTYGDMAGIERAFDLYATSPTYAALIGSGKLSVSLRSIIKLEEPGLPPTSAEVPGFLVLTRWRSTESMTERMRPVVPVFEENGAMLIRYGTSIAGPSTGIRVLAVAYPSMDAIEKTYAALMGDAGYMSIVGDIDIVSRDIIRISG